MAKGLVLKLWMEDAAVIDLREYGLGIARVVLIETRGGASRLLFDFPREVRIDREEIFEKREAGVMPG